MIYTISNQTRGFRFRLLKKPPISICKTDPLNQTKKGEETTTWSSSSKCFFFPEGDSSWKRSNNPKRTTVRQQWRKLRKQGHLKHGQAKFGIRNSRQRRQGRSPWRHPLPSSNHHHHISPSKSYLSWFGSGTNEVKWPYSRTKSIFFFASNITSYIEYCCQRALSGIGTYRKTKEKAP